jgi:hypothetical protein
VVWLAHYTGSGLQQIMDMDTDLFHLCLQAAIESYQKTVEAQRRLPQNVEIVTTKE